MLVKTVQVAIVNEQSLFRKTLNAYLSIQENISVAFDATNILEMKVKMRNKQVDVLLLDPFLSETNMNQVVMALRTEYLSLKILMVSMHMNVDQVIHLLDSGIHGYISETDDPEDLLLAIRAVAENRVYRNHLFTEALYFSRQERVNSSYHEPNASLSEREKKILQLIWAEKSNKEIADELFLGVRSIEKIRQDLKEKLGVKSTVGLLKYAISKDIIMMKTQVGRKNVG
jgi:DNA-binding NarL/FixJ family response regulator